MACARKVVMPKHGRIQLKGGEAMSVYEAMMVMIAFATLIHLIAKEKNRKK